MLVEELWPAFVVWFVNILVDNQKDHRKDLFDYRSKERQPPMPLSNAHFRGSFLK